MKQVLTIAGSDSGGGGGIQADIKTIQANGAYALSVVTSITAQNTMEIRQAYDLPLRVIEAQLDAVLEDFVLSAVKTGMLSTPGIVRAVARRLGRNGPHNLVVDPVMISKSGFPLLKPMAVSALISELIPLAAIVTPNVPEAEFLSGQKIESMEDATRAAEKIRAYGCRAVLVKGGHLPGEEASDLLHDGEKIARFSRARIHTRNTHGTGCTYSAAIATHLALGKELAEAVQAAKDYVTGAIRYALEIGRGQGPVHHFYILERNR